MIHQYNPTSGIIYIVFGANFQSWQVTGSNFLQIDVLAKQFCIIPTGIA